MTPLHADIIAFLDRGFNVADIPPPSDNDIIQSLKEFDALYHVNDQTSDDESPVTDAQYDALYLYAKILLPTHKYFIGVGSDIRGGKVDLPYEMGSLNQVQIGDIREWVNKHQLQRSEHVVSDKMDGTSTMAVYDSNGAAQIAYSRGNGVQGADISRHIFKIKGVPTKCDKVLESGLVIRAEVELTETAFKALYDAGIRRKGGAAYKNPRNMVAGLMNSETIPAICYEHLSLVTYEVLGIPANKKMQLRLLEVNGFQVVKYSIVKGSKLTDDFLAKFLADRKADLDYAIDGVVIEVNTLSERQRMNPTKETLNPGYAIKYKVADASNQAIATVKSVTWNISKHGYLKPQINIEPVELVGVTVQNCTGFNAAFIMNNGVGPGAKIQMTRSGDVIPFCQSVITPAVPQMPGMIPAQRDWDWDWTYNDDGDKVDAKLTNIDDHDEVAIQQTLDFFASIEAPNLKEGSVRKMFEAHQYASAHSAIYNMLHHDETVWKRTIGENGKKIYAGIRDKMNNIPLHVLMGSLPFFGRGVGKRKFKKLEIALGTKGLHNLYEANRSTIIDVDGFSDKTVDKVLDGIDEYYEFYTKMPDYVNVITMKDTSGGVLDGQKICMTGFRDKDLSAKVEELGGTLQSGVSGATDILVIKDPTSTSGKAKKARDLNVKLMGIDEFKKHIGV